MFKTQGSRLLNDVSPRLIPTALACKIGVVQAVLLQQLQYWLEHSGKYANGDDVLWIYNSYPKWHRQFPFWGKNTIIRGFRALEESGLIRTARFNDRPSDRTLWYTIDYSAVDALMNPPV